MNNLSLTQLTAFQEGLKLYKKKLIRWKRNMWVSDSPFDDPAKLNQMSNVTEQLLNDITIVRNRKITELKNS
jgi:hypothetical protein